MGYNIYMLNKKGFTLIDLMLTISIIVILSSVSTVNISIAKKKARDSIRLKELNELSKGLEIYFSEHGVYPCGDVGDGATGTLDASEYIEGCQEGMTHQENIAGFLNATGLDPATANCNTSIGPQGGLFSEGITTNNCPQDPYQSENIQLDPAAGIKYTYLYQVNAARNMYVLVTYLETGDTIMANDGGRCQNLYEVGNGAGTLAIWQWGIGTANDNCF